MSYFCTIGSIVIRRVLLKSKYLASGPPVELEAHEPCSEIKSHTILPMLPHHFNMSFLRFDTTSDTLRASPATRQSSYTMERTALLKPSASSDRDSRERSPAPSYRTIESELPRYAEYNGMPLPAHYARAIEMGAPDRDPTVELSREDLRQICRHVLQRRRGLIGQLRHYRYGRLLANDIESAEGHDDEVEIGGWKCILITFSGLTIVIILAFAITVLFRRVQF